MDQEWIRLSIGLITTINDTLFGMTGDYALLGGMILLLFLVVFLMVGLELRYSVMLIAPLAIAMSFGGWFPIWLNVVFWLMVVGLGTFLVYRAYEGY